MLPSPAERKKFRQMNFSVSILWIPPISHIKADAFLQKTQQ